MLSLLSFSLGLAELGVTQRAHEWQSSQELGIFGLVYFISLGIGVFLSPRLRLSSSARAAVAIVASSIPIAVIGAILLGADGSDIFVWALIAWGVSGVGAGILDPAFNEQAGEEDRPERPFAVAALGWRYAAILFVSGLTYGAVALGVAPGLEYIAIAALLLVPLVGVRRLPSLSPGNNTPAFAWILAGMGGYMALAVLPTTASFAWIGPVLGELGASPSWGTGVTSIFVAVEFVSCLVWSRRQSRPNAPGPVRTAVQGLVVSAAGAVLLAAAVINAHHPFGSTAWTVPVAATGLGLLGWGTAPLPQVIIVAASRRGNKGTPLARISTTSLIQAVLVGGGNLGLGSAASAVSSPIAFTAIAGACIAGLLIFVRLLRDGPQPHEPQAASA